MDIILDKKSPIEGSIKIKLKESDYQPLVEEKLKNYAKTAQIKGFRPGKVPQGMIKKMYGKGVMIEEINNLLSKNLNAYIREQNLPLLGEPIPDTKDSEKIDWETQKDFEFTFNIGLVDDFKLDVSPKQKIRKYKIEQDKKAFNETILRLCKDFGEKTPRDRSDIDSTLTGTLSNSELDISKEVSIPVADIEKKEQKKFIGIKSGETIILDPAKVLKTGNLGEIIGEDLVQKITEEKASLNFTITEVTNMVPSEKNQEFFDKVFGKDAVKTEAEFDQKVKDTIAENYDRESDKLLERYIYDHLLKETKINTPDKFLKEWLLLSNEGKISKDQIDTEFKEYLKDLKWSLIKNKIAKEQDLDASEEEVMEKARATFIEQLGGPMVAAQFKEQMDGIVKNYLQGENGNNYVRTYNLVRDEKIMAYIRENITIQEKKTDPDGFKKAVEALA